MSTCSVLEPSCFFFDMQAQKGVRLHGSSTVLDHFDLLALPRHAGRFEVFPSLGGEIFKTSWQCKFLLCSHEVLPPLAASSEPIEEVRIPGRYKNWSKNTRTKVWLKSTDFRF
ncbi:unnamed protein product [Cladocopium goreaui]|uniref:Uncharacterized protein n=1 Tax=Cladocopium goreaui TaxID=2562237 RepID=A0A9P1DRY6_9DINO|nr:unnamed protein product [Cladocopium goreaui]